MLDLYKQQYSSKNIQFILTDHQGNILESDQAFLIININGSIFEIHPFFESLSLFEELSEEELNFNCVNLFFNEQEYTTDIKIIKKDEGILFILYDLTNHYIDYQSIAQSRNESTISKELVALKNLELEERELFKNRFIQNFSHELRNPLTGIISITKIIESTELTDAQRKMLDFLMESSTNLKLLLEDILSISMIGSGKLNLNNKVFNLFQLLDLLEYTYKAQAKEKGVEFSIKKDAKIPEFLEGDRLRLFQVLSNLLNNAVKYCEKGKVSLAILFNQKRASKINLRFEVSDTGNGIAEQDFPIIFESFSRLKTAENQSGSGIGLSIVSGLLELMNSEIKVKSTVGEGSIFYFDIAMKYPLQLASKSLLKVDDKKKANVRKPSKGDKFKLLLVEDDLAVQTILFKLLIKTKHFYIDFVDDGDKVMTQIVSEQYDIILMDVELPNTNGDEIARQIRNFPFKNIQEIPIVGITANAYQENITSYLEAGMNVVFPKPFDNDLLIEAIYKLLK